MNQSEIVHLLDLFGIAVFAVSGALEAGRKRMDIFGVIVLGLATAIGGGTLRDLLLDNGPVFWIADQTYLFVAVASAILTFVAVRRLQVPLRGLLVSDALGLAVFTLIGTTKALEATGSESLAVVMGIMTGTAGGMIRDILAAEVPLILRKEIYATAALCGSLVYLAASHLPLPSLAPPAASVLATLSIRLAAIRWKLSLPVFLSKHPVLDSEAENGNTPGTERTTRP